jgi:hypothetical protein
MENWVWQSSVCYHYTFYTNFKINFCNKKLKSEPSARWINLFGGFTSSVMWHYAGEVFWSSEGSQCLHFHRANAWPLKMKALQSAEMSETAQPTKEYHIPNCLNPQQHQCENLNSRKISPLLRRVTICRSKRFCKTSYCFNWPENYGAQNFISSPESWTSCYTAIHCTLTHHEYSPQEIEVFHLMALPVAKVIVR